MPTFALPAWPAGVPGSAYEFFYLAGFALGGALLLRAGRRYGWRRWLLLVAATLCALIIGTKLIAYRPADWQAWLAGSPLPAYAGRSILGGLVAASAVLALTRRLLGFGRTAYDEFAPALLLGLAVQGLGCLWAGCCYGVAAAPPWPGLTYGPGTIPYQQHAGAGLLAAGTPHCQPLAPVQLYQSLLCLGLAWGLYLCRAKLKPGQAWWLALLGYALVRFGLEFWRDAAGDVVGSGFWLGLKPVQWGLLAAVAALLPLLRKRRTAAPDRWAQLPNWPLVLGLLGLTAALGPHWLDAGETLIIKALLLAVLGLEAYYWLARAQWQPMLGLLGLGAVLMSQAPAPAADSVQERRMLIVSTGALYGTYDQEVITGGACSSGSTLYDHRYRAVGADIALRTEHATGYKAFGLGLWGGTERIGYRQVPALGYQTKVLHDLHPYFEVQQSLQATPEFNAGLRAGLHLGNLSNQLDDHWFSLQHVKPELMLRLGWRRWYGQFDAGYGVLGLGNYTARLGLGYDFGARRQSHLLGGVAAAAHTNHENSTTGYLAYVGGQLWLGRSGLGLTPYAASNFQRLHQLSLQLNYQLPVRR